MPDFESNTPQITLNILATSDVHGALSSEETEGATGGLSRIASLVADLRRTHKNCLLVDNGDFLQGTPLCDCVASGQIATPEGHPVILAMNHMKYDVVGLGNHEFDYGIPFLKRALETAEFPVIGSNVYCRDQPWKQAFILERGLIDDAGQAHLIKIGFLSLLPEQVSAWNARHLEGRLKTQDITQAAVEMAQDLRRSGAQIVIALAHSGIAGEEREDRQENAAIPIAKTAGIDAIVCGHTHRLLPDPGLHDSEIINFSKGMICNIPAVMPGFDSSHLGHISLHLARHQDTMLVGNSESKLYTSAPTQGTDWPIPDESITQLALLHEAECAALLSAPIGHIELPIHSFYSHLPGDPSVALVAQAQLEYARQSLQDHLPVDIPVISSASPFKCGGRSGSDNYVCVSPGPVTQLNLTRLHPFQNTLVAMEIRGAQLKDWLEMAVSCFNQIFPDGHYTALKNPDFPCYGFDTVYGVNYAIDLTQPAKYNVLGHSVTNSARISDLTCQGLPVSDDQRFVMLTTSYRAGGGGNFPNVKDCRRFEIPVKDSRVLLAEFIARGVSSDRIPPAPWTFKPISKANVMTKIGGGVLPFFAQGQLPEIGITAGVTDGSGFVPFSIDFND